MPGYRGLTSHHVHRSVQRRRDELNDAVAAIHEPREPWEISFFDAEARLLAIPESSASDVRFRRDALASLTADAYLASRERLENYVARGGLQLRTSGSPWATADIRTPEQASGARDLIDRLLEHTLPTARRLCAQGAQETNLTERVEVPVWRTWIELWREAEQVLTSFDTSVFDQDLQALLVALRPMQAGSLKRMGAAISSGEYRAAKRTLKALRRDGARASFDTLERAATLVQRWREYGHGAPAVPNGLDAITGASEQLDRQLAEVEAFLPGSNALVANADDLQRGLRGLLADQVTLNRLPTLYELRSELERLELSSLLKELARRQADPDLALEIFEHAWLCSIVDEVGRTDALIAGFDGTQHRRAVADYRRADRQHVETTALRVRRICAEHAVAVQDEHREQSDLVRYQASLKRKHLPIRQLFEAAPDVLTALKPCWVMSPLLVSQLLPADHPYFDVVVFDEASQIEPADAIPAILRGKNVVVAGDDRQLPPTSFFATGAPQEEDADVDPARLAVGTDFESILDALSAFMPRRMLLWHYRSRDERLIAFSNGHFYDRALTTFPGISENDCLEHVLVPFSHGYQGSKVSASAEVETVVDLILRHAAERPDESLGVIAMGLKHAERIDELLRQRLHDRPDLNDFFDEAREEKFFVKNLERVQGDERDAIILSIGYGKGADGRLRYFFGPLNNQGGERRLNVAITRAKRRLTLVSSFSSMDMDPEKGAEGVRLLRQYLQYAESRGANLGEAALAKPQLNPFEIDVRDSLERAGVPVVAQWGCSGYFIDYVAKHPRDPGRLVLAIECDGAAYHSSSSARDRDRLRQDHLERLGWRFHRIWSTDWFRDKAKEIDAAKAAYDAAVLDADEPPRRDRVSVAEPQSRTADVTTAPTRDPWPAGVRRGLPIGEYRPGQLEAVIRYVESDTLLRTQDELVQAVMDELGFLRRGKNIVSAIEAAIIGSRRADAR
jgi:very-short-patch-repair endonuclease